MRLPKLNKNPKLIIIFAAVLLVAIVILAFVISRNKDDGLDNDTEIVQVEFPNASQLEAEGKLEEAAAAYILMAEAEGGEEAGFLIEKAAKLSREAENYEQALEYFEKAAQTFNDNGQEEEANRLEGKISSTEMLKNIFSVDNEGTAQ
ncbi:MAG: hypothetical protein R3313_03760 [Candidatus Saccharimonadales bacterium]|nr:hypothetical protein [Candidatus Saccharimonadales bacterium]